MPTEDQVASYQRGGYYLVLFFVVVLLVRLWFLFLDEADQSSRVRREGTEAWHENGAKERRISAVRYIGGSEEAPTEDSALPGLDCLRLLPSSSEGGEAQVYVECHNTKLRVEGGRRVSEAGLVLQPGKTLRIFEPPASVCHSPDMDSYWLAPTPWTLTLLRVEGSRAVFRAEWATRAQVSISIPSTTTRQQISLKEIDKQVLSVPAFGKMLWEGK